MLILLFDGSSDNESSGDASSHSKLDILFTLDFLFSFSFSLFPFPFSLFPFPFPFELVGIAEIAEIAEIVTVAPSSQNVASFFLFFKLISKQLLIHSFFASKVILFIVAIKYNEKISNLTPRP